MYYTKKSIEGPWDYIIIGSGMGSMTCASLLSKFGKRVLVLEQHYVPGGFTHVFKRKKWVWDVGIHNVGQVTEHSLAGRILADLTNNQLIWASLGDIHEEFHFQDGFQVNFPNHPEKLKESLYGAFPYERKAIDGYLLETREVARSMLGHITKQVLPKGMHPLLKVSLGKKADTFFNLRTNDVVEELTFNERLRATLTAHWAYYGSPPTRGSFGMHALVANSYRYGGYFPCGGSERIAYTLLEPITKAGSAVRVNSGVKELIIKKKKAIGVRLEDGEEIFANRIISGTGALSTIKHLLPAQEQQKPWCQEILNLPPSPAHVALHLGLKGDIRQAGATRANKWFFDVWDRRIESWDFDKSKDTLAPALYVSFNSLKDPEHQPGPDNLHSAMVITLLPWDKFAAWKDTKWMKRGKEYEALKDELSDRLLSQLYSHMPDLKPMTEYVELSTPLSTEYFGRSVKGSIYGIETTPARFSNPWLRPATPIKNFYLTGCDIGFPGVIGALMGGVLTSTYIEPTHAIPYLIKML